MGRFQAKASLNLLANQSVCDVGLTCIFHRFSLSTGLVKYPCKARLMGYSLYLPQVWFVYGPLKPPQIMPCGVKAVSSTGLVCELHREMSMQSHFIRYNLYAQNIRFLTIACMFYSNGFASHLVGSPAGRVHQATVILYNLTQLMKITCICSTGR